MLSNLTQVQISGFIALLVSTPFLIKSVRNLYLASASKKWTKLNGTIIEMSNIGRRYNLKYEYTINRTTYKSHRICFTNSNRRINQSVSEFMEKYAVNRIVDVFYNPIKPKQSVLEPGKKDGLMLAIIMLSVLFIFGCLAVFNQAFFLELINPYFEIQ